MHELHLMKQVVRAVEAGLKNTPDATPTVVRLKVRSNSHLREHDLATLQMAFALAARGTKVERAVMEVMEFSGDVWCSHCQWNGASEETNSPCPRCGGLVLRGEQAPELVVHEVVVEG